MIHAILRTAGIGLLLCLFSGSLMAQFQYIGGAGQVLIAPTQGSQAIVSASWLMQFSAHHGVGVELGLPFYFSRNPAKQYEAPLEPWYNVEMDWSRNMSPILTARYRFFMGNAPFIGFAIGGGVISESLVASRNYQAGSTWIAEVPAVDIDQSIKSPIVRFTAEAGLMPNIGERMYALVQGGIGLQLTANPISAFGEVDFGENETYRLRPYHGKDIFGNFQFGLGVKL
jgi:hypothetical protein